MECGIADGRPGVVRARGGRWAATPRSSEHRTEVQANRGRRAAEYDQEASALRVAGQIRVPTLIVTFIPFESFHHPASGGNRSMTLMAPEHGGHCAFISRNGGCERFWAESRVVEFCAEHSEIVGYGQAH